MDELGNLHGDHVFSRGEALDFGYDDRDLRDALIAGVLAKVRHGAYVAADTWAAADPVERHRLQAHAVLRSHKTPVALSHVSAAAEHGLRLHQPKLDKVHVVSLDKPLARTTPDVSYHRPPARGAEIENRPDGVRVVDPLRAAIETASMGSIPSGLVVLDGIVNNGIASLEQVHSAFASFHGPGGRKLQITVRLVREGAESAGETLGRELCWSQHLPEPQLQFEVYDEDGVLVGRTDYAWPEFGLLGEFDGLIKYHRFRKPGETIEEAVVREKKREDRLREITGWLMIRLIWADLYRPIVTGRRIAERLSKGRLLLAS